ncbi:MAG: hypothetical protein JWN98_634 [Abditibacteriota bacterium]|nr:hypothetical protein [Abditibacteriota bacterium]
MPQDTAPELQLGGQALIEGVMMRSPRFVAAAVRRADGTIQTRVEAFESIIRRKKWLGLPFIRGVVGLFEMMLLGTRYLKWSSNLALLDDETQSKDTSPTLHQSTSNTGATNATHDNAARNVAVEASAVTAATGLPIAGSGGVSGVQSTLNAALPASEDSSLKAEPEKLPLWAFAGTVMLSLSLGMGLFVALPNIITDLTLERYTQNRIWLNLGEGVIKMIIFIAYLSAIGRMPNIRRVWQYHGAEHKVVYAAENKRPITPDGARPFDTPHPRCGTGFALLTVLVSVVCFTFLPWTESHLQRVAMRFALMPLIAGLSYEILKATTIPRWKGLAVLIMTPGLWLQRLTTAQPDDEQLEVSCTAMRAVIEAEENAPAAAKAVPAATI